MTKPKWPVRVRDAGSLQDAKLLLWRACVAAEAGMYRAMADDDLENVRRFVHALQQACSSYASMVETVDLAAELDELKQQLPLRRVS